MNIDAYLQAVGVTSSQLVHGADPESLKLIYSHHVRALPFCSVPIICGYPVDPSLGIAGIVDKMLKKRWGGVCFEHVALMGAALERLGFNVTYLGGEIWRDGWTPTHTHASLLVSFPDRTQYYCDVGFPLRPLEPLLLAHGKEQLQSDGRCFMLEKAEVAGEAAVNDPRDGDGDVGGGGGGSYWGVHQLEQGDYVLRHRFRLRPCCLAEDFAGPARDLSRPDHRFSQGWMTAICRPDGALVTLATGPWAGSQVREDKAKYVCRQEVIAAGCDGGGRGAQQSLQHSTLMTRGSAALRSLAETEFRLGIEGLGCADFAG